MGEFQQVRNAEQRPTPAQNDLGIRSDNVRPLGRNRENCPIVILQQQHLPKTVVTLLYADELLPAKRMKGMRHTHKMCACDRSPCILKWVTRARFKH